MKLMKKAGYWWKKFFSSFLFTVLCDYKKKLSKEMWLKTRKWLRRVWIEVENEIFGWDFEVKIGGLCNLSAKIRPFGIGGAHHRPFVQPNFFKKKIFCKILYHELRTINRIKCRNKSKFWSSRPLSILIDACNPLTDPEINILKTSATNNC